MAQYGMHVGVACGVGVAASVGVSLGLGFGINWISSTGATVFLLSVLLGVVGGMYPDLDHDTGKALPEVAGLLTTILPLVVVISVIPTADEKGPWAVILALPAHFFLHFFLNQVKWLRGHRGIKPVLRSLFVAGLCFLPFAFLLRPSTWELWQFWGALFAVAILIQLSVPLFKKFTVHRGIFHSIPGIIVYSELAFLFLSVTTSFSLYTRLILTCSAFAGALSHLILDEIFSVDFDGKKIRAKRSMGSAINLWERKYPLTSALTYGAIIGLAAVGYLMA